MDGLKPETSLQDLRQLRDEFTRFMLEYQFGIDEVTTKVEILQEEFAHLHHENPIEHVSSRLKSPESLIAKVQRRGCPPDFPSIREQITDIAGVRITCSFTADVYRMFEALTNQPDLTLLLMKDYIAAPKPNGYRSLHAIFEVPVHLSDRIVPVTVEVQLRTVAMDFWASLEHKIYYRYHDEVPLDLRADLKDAAETAAELDARMADLHRQTQEREIANPHKQQPALEITEALARQFAALLQE